jgi:hypothetical protein
MLPPILRKGEGLAQVCALPHALDQVLKSMPIVTDFQCTVQFYRDNFEQLHIPRPRDCPHCQASDMFIGHGAYWRKALDRWEDYRIRVQRWRCKACRRTVSILPSFLLRHRHYLLAVIQDVVTARFEEDASWGQIEQQGTNESGDDCVPSERTVRRWCASFAEQAPHWLAAVQQTLAQQDATLPLLDPLGEATGARSPAGALLHGATQLLAWAKTEWAELADYGLSDRLRFLWHWGHAQGLGRFI